MMRGGSLAPGWYHELAKQAEAADGLTAGRTTGSNASARAHVSAVDLAVACGVSPAAKAGTA
jgi:hypothetical protein